MPKTRKPKKPAKKSILDVVMPNGKPLGKCTFAEVRGFGRHFNRIAKSDGPDECVITSPNISPMDKAFAMHFFNLRMPSELTNKH